MAKKITRQNLNSGFGFKFRKAGDPSEPWHFLRCKNRQEAARTKTKYKMEGWEVA